MVEANANLGGKVVKQGINMVRFSNHVPPFEQGVDVITRITMNHINWNSYTVNQIQDRVDVFVSIISTKVPSKGTGTKYVGNDITKIVTVVKTVKSVQLTTKIVKRNNHTSGKSVTKLHQVHT